MKLELIQVGIGSCGAFVAEIQHWRRIRHRGTLPRYARRIAFWAITLSIVLAGGVTAAIVSDSATSHMQLFMLGMVGPQLLFSTAQSRLLSPRWAQRSSGRRRSGLEFLGA